MPCIHDNLHQFVGECDECTPTPQFTDEDLAAFAKYLIDHIRNIDADAYGLTGNWWD